MDGLEVAREIRRDSTVPVVMLTARGRHIDVVVGLEAGADDYVRKPFEVPELVAASAPRCDAGRAGPRTATRTLRLGSRS
jgi:DNA-binding response OmpR family regulator